MNLAVSNAKVYNALKFLLDEKTQKFSRVASQALAQSNSDGIVKLPLQISDYGIPVVIIDESTEEMACVLLKFADSENAFKVELAPPIQIYFQLQAKYPVQDLDIELMPRSGTGSYSGVLNYGNVNLKREMPINLELICPFYAGDMLLSIEAPPIYDFRHDIPQIGSTKIWDLGLLKLKIKDGYNVVKKASPALEISQWVKGEPVELNDLKGKVVLLDFWALWCSPCLRGFPELIRLHEKYHREGLVIIAVHHISKNKEEILNTEPSKFDISKVPFRVAIDKAYPEMDDPTEGLSFRAFNVSTLPTKVLISREGIVECYDPIDLENQIRTMLYGNADGKVYRKVIFCCVGLVIITLYLAVRIISKLKGPRI